MKDLASERIAWKQEKVCHEPTGDSKRPKRKKLDRSPVVDIESLGGCGCWQALARDLWRSPVCVWPTPRRRLSVTFAVGTSFMYRNNIQIISVVTLNP